MVASHTHTHYSLAASTSKDDVQIRSEISEAEKVFTSVYGFAPVYMRPVKGYTSPYSLGVLRELGYKVINWDVDTNDWRPEVVKEPKKIVDGMGYFLDTIGN